MGKLVCAIDLGGTNLRAAVVDEAGQICFRIKRPTPATCNTPQEIVHEIVDAVRECERAAAHFAAVTVVVPGTVNATNEIVFEAPNIGCLHEFEMAAALRSELACRVLLENDANAAAVGESWLGAARVCRTLVCITLGTGVGGGIILDGKLWRGADGSAGEIGHTSVEPFSELKCKCGNFGCLENLASATAVVRMIKEELSRFPESELSGEDLSAERVYMAGLNGDQLALEIFQRVGIYLGISIANLVNVLNPEMVVIGGGVANAWTLFEKHLHAEVAQRAFPIPATNVRIVPAECGDDAGLLGASRLGLDMLGI